MGHIWLPKRRLTGNFVEYRDLVTGMGYQADYYPRLDESFALPTEEWQRVAHALALRLVS